MLSSLVIREIDVVPEICFCSTRDGVITAERVVVHGQRRVRCARTYPDRTRHHLTDVQLASVVDVCHGNTVVTYARDLHCPGTARISL